MITSQCLIGVLTDGHISIFPLLKSLQPSEGVIEVDWYLNISAERADEDEKLTARQLMIGLLGYVMGSVPLEYLKKKQEIFGNVGEWALKPFFKEIHSPATIRAYRFALKFLFSHPALRTADLSKNREIVYKIPESDKLQYCQGHFQIFNIPRRVLKDHIDWSGNEDLLAVVFDPSISNAISSDYNDPSIVSKL